MNVNSLNLNLPKADLHIADMHGNDLGLSLTGYTIDGKSPMEFVKCYDIDEEVWQGYILRTVPHEIVSKHLVHTILVNIDEEYAPDNSFRQLDILQVKDDAIEPLPRIAPYTRYYLRFTEEEIQQVEWVLGSLMWFGALGDIIVVEG